jgi:hypothetical protein
MTDGKREVKLEAERRRAIRKTTVAERCAYTAQRRVASRQRDHERVRFAEQCAAAPGLRIPHERGYLRLPPGTLEDVVNPVVADGNALIARLGADSLVGTGGKADFVARGFLPEAAFAIDSPYMRLALDERVVAPISLYLGVVPILMDIDLWYSVHHPKAPKSSQLWHMDTDDTTLVKLWVHLSDVDHRSGPLTVLDATDSARLAEAIAYDYSDGYRVPDERVGALVGPERSVSFEGSVGALEFVDTGRCFHFGSRVSEDGTPRRLLMLEYQTPYSFKFTNHQKEAPYRALAGPSSTDLERLVLGSV